MDMVWQGPAGPVTIGASLVEQWRDLGPVLWVVAAALAALYLVALGLTAAWLDPRRVPPGPRTLDLPGDEAPAVVNLLASDWELGHEAVPATLLDLAGRGHLAVDMVGDRTTVRVKGTPGKGDVTRYEALVLAHLRSLASATPDGVIPAEALTTGPEARSARWWSDFSGAVVADARARGLSRPRWSAGVKSAFVLAAAVVALAFGLAASTIPPDAGETISSQVVPTPEGVPATSTASAASQHDDSNPAVLGIVVAIFVGGGLGALVSRRGGERDTPEGREVAARWLGLADMLGDNPVFAEQPPAGVAIWDKHLGHGAALGVAHGAVTALPMGTESDTEAWSSHGGRWRIVRITYARRFVPGWGASPWKVLLRALPWLALSALALWGVARLEDAVRDEAAAGVTVEQTPVEGTSDLDGLTVLPSPGGLWGTGTDPADALRWVETARPYVTAGALAAGGVGLWFLALALTDLVRRDRVVEGVVVRYRMRGKLTNTTDSNGSRRRRDTRRWYLAIDDGTSNRIRAIRCPTRPATAQGAHVRAVVTPVLRHLRHLSDAPQASPAAEPGPANGAAVPPTPSPPAPPTGGGPPAPGPAPLPPR